MKFMLIALIALVGLTGCEGLTGGITWKVPEPILTPVQPVYAVQPTLVQPAYVQQVQPTQYVQQLAK